MPTALYIDGKPLAQAAAAFESWSENVSDMRPEIEQLAYRLAAHMRRHITQGRLSDGSAIKPLSPAYAKAKARAGFGGKPVLVRTGAFFQSIKPLEVGDLYFRVGPEEKQFVIVDGRDIVSMEEDEWGQLFESAMAAGLLRRANAVLEAGAEDSGIYEDAEGFLMQDA